MNDKLIAQSDLFRGISPEEAAAMLHCLQAVERRYPKGALICRQGEAVPAAGLLLSGEVHIVQDDLWGNQSIFSRIGPGELFSEAYAAVPGAVSLVNAVAAQESSVDFPAPLPPSRQKISCRHTVSVAPRSTSAAARS